MTTAPIGTAVVVLSEPHAGSEREYNRWYEDDHLYSTGMAAPGAMAHRRWVAPKRYKNLRPAGSLFGDPARGSYLIVFWVYEGMQDDWNSWMSVQEQRLRKVDRWDFPKDHIYTGSYRFEWESGVPDGPRAIVALDRSSPGVIALGIERSPGHGLGGIREWAAGLPSEAAPVCVGLTPRQLFKSVLDSPPVPSEDPYVLVLLFCDDDPEKVWSEHLPPHLARLDDVPGAARLGFASPFRATEPGTDRYVDDL